MKFMVYDYASVADKETLSKLGLKHGVVIDGDVWSAAKKLFDAGMSVMLQHIKNNDVNVCLYVDTIKGRFRQR